MPQLVRNTDARFTKIFVTLLVCSLFLITRPTRAQELTLAPCGLPESGVSFVGATYNLTADCVQMGELSFAPPTVSPVTINGNGHTIRIQGFHAFITTGMEAVVNLNNLTLDMEAKVLATPVSISGTLNAKSVTFTRAGHGPMLHMNGGAQANLTDVRFLRNHNLGSGPNALGSALNIVANATVTMTDMEFRENTGGRAAVVIHPGGMLTATGCLTFVENTPADIVGTWTDTSTGPCGRGDETAATSSKASIPEDGRLQNLGALGVLYLSHISEVTLELWGVTPDSEGYFLLSVTQSQVDAVQPTGVVVTSADGFASVSVDAERLVTVSIGPTDEGKTHHIVFSGGIGGHITSTYDTTGGSATVSAVTPVQTLSSTLTRTLAPFVTAQPPRADGSIVHVVQTGDTISAIALAYGVQPRAIVERNNLANYGRWIFPGQELVIRDTV